MSIDMYLGASKSQADSISAMVDQGLQILDQLDSSIQGFMASSSDLKGASYDSARDYVSSIITPMKNDARSYLEQVKTAAKEFPEEYEAQVASEDLKQSELEEKIARFDEVIRQGELALAEMKSHPVGKGQDSRVSSVASSLNMAKDGRAQLKEKLEKLLAFNASSAHMLSYLEGLAQSLTQSRSFTKGAFNTKTQMFTGIMINASEDLNQSISIKEFEKEYGVRRPAGISDDEYDTYLEELYDQATALENDGWTKEAVRDGYIYNVNMTFNPSEGINAMDHLDNCYTEAHTVGSPMFISMMTNAYGDDQKGQEATLKMVYKVLGAEVDGNNFLQMTNMKITADDKQGSYQFTQDMTQALVFDDEFSSVVQGAYPKGLPTKAEEGTSEFTLAQQTHQFRYYLDKKNNDALRATYPDEVNDLERIKRFNEDHPEYAFTGEKARLHNKYQGEAEGYQDQIDQYGENHKYVSTGSGFHSEFIVDKDGNLVSQWNAYEIDETGRVNSDPYKLYTKEEQIQLVDGNSVNYAESSNNGDYHEEYDSAPVSKYDPKVRKEVGKGWKIPVTGADKEELPNYFDRDESEEEANERLHDD